MWYQPARRSFRGGRLALKVRSWGKILTPQDRQIEPDKGLPTPPSAAGTKRRWEHWLTLGANIGVVLGLFILIVEVRQNAALTRAAMEQQKNYLAAEIEFNLARPEIAEAWMQSIHNPEGLTDVDMKMVESILVAVMLQWEYRFQMEEAGLISREEARQHILNAAPFYFGSRFGKHYWSLQVGTWEGTPMMDVAGPIVDAIDENFLVDYFDRLRLPPTVSAPREPAPP